jgi:hypothetical protein
MLIPNSGHSLRAIRTPRILGNESLDVLAGIREI